MRPSASSDASPVRFSKIATTTRFGSTPSAPAAASPPPRCSCRTTTTAITATNATPASIAAAREPHLTSRRAGALPAPAPETAADPAPLSRTESSAKPRSRADWNRSRGCFSRHRRTRASTPAGSSRPEAPSGGGSSFTMRYDVS